MTPAAQESAIKLRRPKPVRLVLKVPETARRALKARAASLGITVATYFLRLAKADGVDVDGGAR